ncbi:MAG: hypothetical protein AAB417_04280 [Patescibacteria group bacterium]
MYDKLEEKERVSWWLDKLNKNLLGWVDGDAESIITKTADLANHQYKLAVELKREKGGSLENKTGNLETLSNRIEDYFKLANEKLVNYPNYKTLLIVELDTDLWSAEVVMEGLPQLHFREGELIGSSIRNRNLYSQIQNIGAVVFWATPKNVFSGKAFYFDNPFADEACKLTQDGVEKIVGDKLDFLELNN